MKKLTSVLLLISLCFMMLASCGTSSGNETATTTGDKPTVEKPTDGDETTKADNPVEEGSGVVSDSIEGTTTPSGTTSDTQGSVTSEEIPSDSKEEEPDSPYSSGLEYTLNDDKESYSLSGRGSCKDEDIIVPDTYEGLPVTGVADKAFLNAYEWFTITLPESVTFIGDYAFANANLTIVLPGNLKHIGDSAFAGATIAPISIPDSIETIGSSAFYCTVESITVPDKNFSVGSYAFGNYAYSTPHLIMNEYGGAYYLGNDSNPYVMLVDVSWRYSADTITIHDQTRIICPGAFSSCENLTNIVANETNANYKTMNGDLYTKDGKTLIQYAIGKPATEYVVADTVEHIANDAFSGSKVKAVTMKDGVKTIGNGAFSNCTELYTVIIPDSVTSIGEYVVDSCERLTSLLYTGSEEQWAAINIGDNNDPLKSVKCNYEPIA